jgi:bis(5'-nucleosyl)-tetraphosphatase (symmetrical)
MPQRRIFVGDVQGCRDELERLLEAVRFDPAADALLLAGDFVNRGPDSAGVLRVCRAAGADGVLGNHDVNLLRVAAGLRAPRRKDTFQDVLDAPDRDALLAWLRARPLVRADADTLLVHGGLHPQWADPVARLQRLDPLSGDPDVGFAITVRYCDANGARQASDDPEPGPPFRPWYEFWPPTPTERRTVVFGHWARGGLVVRPQVRGLDTACVWGGRLTAWIADEDRLVHVKAARAYARPGD